MPPSETDRHFQETLAEHKELRGGIHGLQEFLRVPRPEIGSKGYHTWAASLAEKVVKLHDKVFRHFRKEDEEGLLEDLAVRHPKESGKIEQLRLEHDEILTEIRDLMNATLRYSEGKSPEDPRLRQRAHSTLERLARHERAETELITQVEYDDLGRSG